MASFAENFPSEFRPSATRSFYPNQMPQPQFQTIFQNEVGLISERLEWPVSLRIFNLISDQVPPDRFTRFRWCQMPNSGLWSSDFSPLGKVALSGHHNSPTLSRLPLLSCGSISSSGCCLVGLGVWVLGLQFRVPGFLSCAGSVLHSCCQVFLVPSLPPFVTYPYPKNIYTEINTKMLLRAILHHCCFLRWMQGYATGAAAAPRGLHDQSPLRRASGRNGPWSSSRGLCGD